jgi:hypothetical protein
LVITATSAAASPPKPQTLPKWHGLDAYFPQGVAHKAMPVIAVSASSFAAAGARVTRYLHKTWPDF